MSHDPTNAPEPEPEGRRQRKRRQTMRTIQWAAIDLFDRHGFDRVTVEQVAEAADVSPSTVYRHFGTKEGLVVRDEYDELVVDSVLVALADLDLIDALGVGLAEIASDQFETDLPMTKRRLRYLFEVESVRAATLVVAADWADELARAMIEAKDGADPIVCHTQTRAVIFGFLAAFEQWWLAGADEPVIDVAGRAMVALRFPPASG